ncbi:hypothetical protein QQ045_033641 [Rhodiola kirilowii]
MAEKQEDDDEAFGDFTFASSFSQSPQPQINASTSLSNNIFDADDDDWGDFVTPKSESAANQQSQSYQTSGDRVLPDPAESNCDAAHGKGVRARGALPLSIFGEEEGNEEEKEKGSDDGFGGAEVFIGKSGDMGKKGSDLSGLGISDILASLYDQGGGGGRQIRKENGVNQNNGLNLDGKGSLEEFDVLDSNSNGYVNGFSSNVKSPNQTEVSTADNWQRMTSNESLFSFSMVNSGSDGFSSSAKSFNQAEVIKVENGRRTKSDESVFSFLMPSSGSDVFGSSAKPSNAAEPVKNDNGWTKSTYELDFNLSTSELGNKSTSIETNDDVNGMWLGTNELSKSSSTEDNDDDDGWEFQGNTNLTKEHEDDKQWEIMSTNISNNVLKLDSYKSELGPNLLHINSSKEDDTRGEWEFQGTATPTAIHESNEAWDFQGNGNPTAKENDDGVWDFQGVANPTANGENNDGWDFVGDSNAFVEEEEDSGWEFQVAPVDQNAKKEWDSGMQGFGAQGAALKSDSQVAGIQLESPQMTDLSPKHYLGTDNPTGASAPSGDGFGFDGFVSSTIHQNEPLADSVSKGKQYETENQLISPAHDGNDEEVDSYWDLQDSFLETKSKNEVKKVDVIQKGALPSSLFSDEPLDSNDSLNQDAINSNPPQSHCNGFKNMDSSASLSDLILNLYNQAENKSSADSPRQAVTNNLDPIQPVNESNFSDDEDDFDGTWDFKDASLSSRAEDLSSSEVHHSNYTKSKMENLVDFYCKLKDQSCLAAICHFSSLKEAKSIAEQAKEDSEVEALDEKIQDVLEELNKANIVLEDVPENCTPHSCLEEFHQVLSEPKFQMLESEYGLSRRLSEAEKDLRSAIHLVEHASSVLKVLSMGSTEQQSSYISTWTEILFVCAQELQHGASIWQRAVEKSVHTQILSHTKGKNFVHALGEIFRVVTLLEASSKAYRPWILSSSMDHDSIFTLLKECSTLWSSSGLNDTLKSLSDPANSECAEEILALLESVSRIHELDVPYGSLRQQDSVCGLSLLTGAMIPDVKMIVWNGEQFFLPLANVWANLISSDHPKLPGIHAG